MEQSPLCLRQARTVRIRHKVCHQRFLFAFPPHPVQLTPITHNGVEVVPMAQGSWAETLICLPERDF